MGFFWSWKITTLSVFGLRSNLYVIVMDPCFLYSNKSFQKVPNPFDWKLSLIQVVMNDVERTFLGNVQYLCYSATCLSPILRCFEIISSTESMFSGVVKEIGLPEQDSSSTYSFLRLLNSATQIQLVAFEGHRSPKVSAKITFANNSFKNKYLITGRHSNLSNSSFFVGLPFWNSHSFITV